MQDRIRITPNLEIPTSELQLRFSRSSGPGGQKVNKTATRVELYFDVANSPSLTNEQRARLLDNLQDQLEADGTLRLAASGYASQWRNRQAAIERLREVLARGLRVPKRRIATRPTRASVERRLDRKRQRAETKRRRRKIQRQDW